MAIISKSCGQCGRSLPLSTSVGGACPYCGSVFGNETTSTRYVRQGIDWRQFFKILLVLFMLAFIMAFIMIGVSRSHYKKLRQTHHPLPKAPIEAPPVPVPAVPLAPTVK